MKQAKPIRREPVDAIFSKNFGDGLKDGYEYCLKNWQEDQSMNVFPQGVHDKPGYSNGWAEGIMTARSEILSKLYPNAKSLTYDKGSRKFIAYY